MSTMPEASDALGTTIVRSTAYSVCDRVQGAAFSGDTAVLSRSWGLSDSQIGIYDVGGESDSTFAVEGKDVPLFVLDSKRETATVKAPHMSEDLEFSGGKLLIAFEGGTLKYGAGILPFSLHKVMRIDVGALIGANG